MTDLVSSPTPLRGTSQPDLRPQGAATDHRQHRARAQNAKDHRGWTALHTAAYYGPLAEVDDLLKRRASTSARDNVGAPPPASAPRPASPATGRREAVRRTSARRARAAAVPLPPPSRTKWTRLVHPSVLTGHVFLISLSLRQVAEDLEGLAEVPPPAPLSPLRCPYFHPYFVLRHSTQGIS